MNAPVKPTIAIKMLFALIYWEIFHACVNLDLVAMENLA